MPLSVPAAQGIYSPGWLRTAEQMHALIQRSEGSGWRVHNVQALWGQLMWLWNRPTIQRLRFMFSMANLSVRLPAVMAIIGTQIGLLSTQVPLDTS